VYGHFLPSEYTGYADALSQPSNAPYTHPEPLVPADAQDESLASATGGTGFRLPVVGDDSQIPDHAQQHRPEREVSGATGDQPEREPAGRPKNKKRKKTQGVRKPTKKSR
jgi:hypothetical protein